MTHSSQPRSEHDRTVAQLDESRHMTRIQLGETYEESIADCRAALRKLVLSRGCLVLEAMGVLSDALKEKRAAGCDITLAAKLLIAAAVEEMAPEEMVQ
jgi:hypothetical protein